MTDSTSSRSLTRRSAPKGSRAVFVLCHLWADEIRRGRLDKREVHRRIKAYGKPVRDQMVELMRKLLNG